MTRLILFFIRIHFQHESAGWFGCFHARGTRIRAAAVLLFLLLGVLPLAAKITSPTELKKGITEAEKLSSGALDAELAKVSGRTSAAAHESEIYLRFARLERSLSASDATAIADDARGILAAASALGDPQVYRVVYAGLASRLERASKGDSTPDDAGNNLASRSRDEEIAALRVQTQAIAEQQLQQQLTELKQNQEFQIDAMERRARSEKILVLMLFVCLLLAMALAMALWRINLHRKRQALEDALTGLKNRHFLGPFMEHEAERLRRNALTALILIVDIDHFKEVNDHWGHQAGDEALRQFAGILRGSVRNSDVIARWGGEEFVIVCPQSTVEHASSICNRIRRHLAETPITVNGTASFHMTISIGVSLFSPSSRMEDWEASLARADRALYHVKHHGRDSWLMAPGDGQSAPIMA